MSDAIHEDVSEETEETESKATPNPRGAVMDSIVATVNKQKADEMGIQVEELEFEDSPEASAEETKEEIDKPDEKETEKEADEPDSVEKETQMETIIVDGEEMQVPLSELVDAGKRTLQKETAADKRLAEATKLLNEAKKITSQEDSEEPDEKDGEDADTPDGMDIDAIVEAIQFGDEDDIKKAILAIKSEAVTNSAGESMTPENVQEVVQKEFTRKMIMDELHKPADKGGFKDLLEDPVLSDLYRKKVDEKLQAGGKNDLAMYQAAGKEVREWVSSIAGTPAKKPETLEKKKAKKETIDNIDGANTRTLSDDTKPPKTLKEMRAEGLADLKKARRPVG